MNEIDGRNTATVEPESRDARDDVIELGCASLSTRGHWWGETTEGSILPFSWWF